MNFISLFILLISIAILIAAIKLLMKIKMREKEKTLELFIRRMTAKINCIYNEVEKILVDAEYQGRRDKILSASIDIAEAIAPSLYVTPLLKKPHEKLEEVLDLVHAISDNIREDRGIEKTEKMRDDVFFLSLLLCIRGDITIEGEENSIIGQVFNILMRNRIRPIASNDHFRTFEGVIRSIALKHMF